MAGPDHRESLIYGVPYYTAVEAARMAVGAIEALSRDDLAVGPLQEYLRRA